MKKALSFFLTLIGIVAQAQIPNGYYDNANGKTGEALKIALHDIIKGHTSISYSQIWNAYYSTDHRDDDVTKVWDIYSDIPETTPHYLFDLGSDQCGSYTGEGNCYNREHSWPDSWFKSDGTARTDLHHIFPTDGFVNNQRSSYPYGEVQHASWTSTNGSKLGNCKSSLGYSGTVFEPINAYKGDLARAYFYMSVRYYSEDANWISTGMTNKSVIEDWAMTMLLRWNELDPVSQKEIDRNNVIYNDYQHNRNPFIDHPEYARMIWDPSWAGGTSYYITCATGLQNGTVSAPESAIEGSTVAITATPAPGYMVGSYLVYKTGNPSTTVAVSSNGTFTMPGYDVTVSATFVQNNNYYDITLGNVTHGTINASTYNAKSGTTITLSATPHNGYSLYSWYVFKTGDMSSTVLVNGNSFVMPAFNVTVMATFIQGSVSNGDYVKVTSTPTNWSGEYLMVCSSQNKAFNGTVDNNWGRCSTVTINNNRIQSNANTDTYKVTVSALGSGYAFLLPDGKYMNWTAEKKFSEGTTAVSYSISLNNGNAVVSYGSISLYYNSAGGLRSYSTSGQTPIQLYKKTTPTTTPAHTIHFDSNGGTGSMNDQTVNEFEATALQANTFTREGYVFDGWNTAADGTGSYYADQATVYLLDNFTLYAQWEPLYTVTLATVANGSITASPMLAVEETLITLTATANPGYEFDHWTVTYNGNHTIEVVEDQFEMPAANVTINATFVYVGIPFSQKYYLVTSNDQLIAGRTYLIVNTQYGKALGTTQNNNNRAADDVTINNDVIESIGTTICELTLGGSTGQWTLKDGSKGYLYAAGGSGSNNYLRTQTTLTNEGKWTITLGTNGKATIKTISTSVSRHTIMYNHSGNIFSCYASGQQDVQLFIRSEEFNHTSNETISQFFPFDKHVIHDDACLTINGSFTNTDPSHLVIEDGGQLIHHNDGVKATFKKNIAAYTDGSGWYSLATPFTSFDPSQLAYDNFDLYAYDEDGDTIGKEWINFKAGNFNPVPHDGFLYAHKPSTTLRLTGALNNGDLSTTVNLGFNNAHDDIRGFNLVGNHTAHDIAFSKSADVADGYYFLDNSNAWTFEPGNIVPAGRAFLVKANAQEQTLTLNPSSKTLLEPQPLIRIDLDGDQAFVKLSNGVNMPLLDLRGRHACVFLNRDGKDYILLANDNNEDINLRCQPRQKGKHLLTFTIENANIDYLHLIDQLTGADIDLLKNPTYRFESDNIDCNSRFQLVLNGKAIQH